MQVKDTVAVCREETNADKVLLVGHSAGGWLARAAMGAGDWEDGVNSEDVVAGKHIGSRVELECFQRRPWDCEVRSSEVHRLAS